jgi:hypothetical protein
MDAEAAPGDRAGLPHYAGSTPLIRSPEPGLEALYAALFDAIRKPYRQTYPELDDDGFKYWSMTASQAQSHIINRARVEPSAT